MAVYTASGFADKVPDRHVNVQDEVELSRTRRADALWRLRGARVHESQYSDEEAGLYWSLLLQQIQSVHLPLARSPGVHLDTTKSTLD